MKPSRKYILRYIKILLIYSRMFHSTFRGKIEHQCNVSSLRFMNIKTKLDVVVKGVDL